MPARRPWRMLRCRSPHFSGGRGVGVAPRVPYVVSIAARICAGLLPAFVPFITSRVMSVQRLQVAA